MRINNKRLFKGDVYHEFENYGILKCKDVILVLFNHKFVPIWYIENVFQYINLKSHIGPDGKFIKSPTNIFLNTEPTYANSGFINVRNLRPFTQKKGKTSLNKLQQEEHKTRQELGIEYEL